MIYNGELILLKCRCFQVIMSREEILIIPQGAKCCETAGIHKQQTNNTNNAKEPNNK